MGCQVPSPQDVQDLFSALFEATVNVAEAVGRASAAGFELHEETITQNLLADVGSRLPQVEIKMFTKWAESRESGADWEWWWEGERQWFGALVQAKRLSGSVNGLTVPGYDFGYTPRATETRPNPSRQIDLLLEAAKHRALPAMYALYNSGTALAPAEMCGALRSVAVANAVTVVSAEVASWLLDFATHDQASTASYTRPIACLACPLTCKYLPPAFAPVPQDLGFSPGVAHADLAFSAALGLYWGVARMRIGQFAVLAPNDVIGADVIRPGVRESPPQYVLQALDDGLEDDDADSDTPTHLMIVRRLNQ